MTVHPLVTVAPIRAAVGATAMEVGLAAHGQNEGAALRSIEHVVLTWCRNLDARGELRSALDHRGVRWDDDTDGVAVSLDVTPNGSTATVTR
jgi:hypothetical protein